MATNKKNPTDASTSGTTVTIKKENQEEEIKELEETAMNELLGWYGYERLELKRWSAARANSGSPDPENRKSPDSKDDCCAWCNNPIKDGATPLTHLGARYCSENCFSQSRRANFKRAKTCDWCRHVRHTVAYVDFQDGASQLQFCSDKCLNQYKMHIFCRETQAHLQLHPHLEGNSSASNLITPDMWMKNCRSGSSSPITQNEEYDRLLTPPTETQRRTSTEKPVKLTTALSVAKLKVKTEKELRRESRAIRIQTKRTRPSRCSTITSPLIPKASPPLKPHLPSPKLPISPPRLATARPIPPLHPFFFQGSQNSSSNGHNPRREQPSNDKMSTNHFQSFGFSQPPPMTVLVPYPVILPMPIPIPIPLPITAFLNMGRAEKNLPRQEEEFEGPLDCTVNTSSKQDFSNDIVDVTPEKVPANEEHNPDESLPKFKITRSASKMAKKVKEVPSADSMRPLRKRRRLVELSTDEDLTTLRAKAALQV